MLFASIYNGLAIGLTIVFMGNSIKVLMQEWQLDGQFIHFALIALIPLLFMVSLFFTLQMFQNISMAIGPIAQYFKNLRYYSAMLHVLPAFNAPHFLTPSLCISPPTCPHVQYFELHAVLIFDAPHSPVVPLHISSMHNRIFVNMTGSDHSRM
ncbi:hypothetical protein EDC04DRAFT_2641341 [Pisolithus marmoratus]|nr:hypothetical protein EDC04DRAFT_2641341 [Pisolithus marmoratus]